MFNTFSAAAVSEESDPLDVFKIRLSVLNKTYDLNYMIPEETATDGDYSEIIDFFSDMSLDEFDEYILSLKDDENTLTSYNVQLNLNQSAMPMSSSYMQKFIYGSSLYNYFYIVTNRAYTDNCYRYLELNDVNYIINSYPSYKLTNNTCSFIDSRKKVNVIFSADKYVSNTICNATGYQFNITFSASGGDIYGGGNV